MKDINRHPPDDGLVEAKIATFDGFWQFQTLDTGLSCSQPATLAAERRKCRICCHPDAPLPWVSLERMTIKHFTRVLVQAAAAVPRSAAGCRQTNFSGWRPRPFGMRRNDPCCLPIVWRIFRQQRRAFDAGNGSGRDNDNMRSARRRPEHGKASLKTIGYADLGTRKPYADALVGWHTDVVDGGPQHTPVGS